MSPCSHNNLTRPISTIPCNCTNQFIYCSEYIIIMFIYHNYVLFVNIGIQYAKEIYSNSRCVMLTHIICVDKPHIIHTDHVFTH